MTKKQKEKTKLEIILGSVVIASIVGFCSIIYKSCSDHDITDKNIQHEKEEACKADVTKKYDIENELDKLDSYITTIGDMTQKYSDYKKGTGAELTDEEKAELRRIYNDLTFIRSDVKGSEPLKSMMEYYLKMLLPDLIEPGKNPTPKTGSTTMDNLLVEYKNNLREYIAKQIETEVAECLNKAKENK